jgi:hypothetical protein
VTSTQGRPAPVHAVQRRPVRTADHLRQVVHPNLHALGRALREANGFNAKVAVFVTNMVGTMWCAYLFTALALIGLPAALKPGGEGLVAWVAQTFLQLVLLSVIMVGQNVQSVAADARAENTFRDTETILDRLDVHTEGGLKAILDRIDALEARLPPGAA